MFAGRAFVRPEGPRGEIAAAWAGAGCVREIDVEALVLGIVGVATEVPFAEMGGGVARLFVGFGQGEVIGVEPGFGCGLEGLEGGWSLSDDGLFQDDLGQVGAGNGDAEAGGPLAGEDAGAGGAEGAGGVGLGEADAAGGEFIDVGGFAKGAAADGGVAPAEGVSEDEDDVGRAGGGGGIQGLT